MNISLKIIENLLEYYFFIVQGAKIRKKTELLADIIVFNLLSK